MTNKSTSQSVLIGLFVVLAFALCNSSVLAQTPTPTTTWTDRNGDWFNDHNWSNNQPYSSTIAYINNGGTANINAANAEALALFLGDGQQDSGTVSVAGGGHYLAVFKDCGNNVPGEIDVGKRGSGSLYITNGGAVLNAHAYVARELNMNLPTSNGVVKMSGLGTNGNPALWYIAGDGQCNAGLFIGCREDTTLGGTGSVSVGLGAEIDVVNPVEAPQAIKVGLSGTLTGGGVITLHGPAPTPSQSSETADIYGTIQPSGTLIINGNIFFRGSATTVCQVTAQGGADEIYLVSQSGENGGHARLDGLLLVTMYANLTPGHTYTLLHADAGIAPNTAFSHYSLNLPPNQCYLPEIQYDANNVYLYLKPTCN